MQTVEELIKYVDENSLAKIIFRKNKTKHLDVAIKHLDADEKVLACFLGYYESAINATGINASAAFLITADRLLIARKTLRNEMIKVILRSELSEVHVQKDAFFSNIYFTTAEGRFGIQSDFQTITNIHNVIQPLLLDTNTMTV